MQHMLLGAFLFYICVLNESFFLRWKGYNRYLLRRDSALTMSFASPDEKQREAITTSSNSSIMVIAGPGAGKSRVLSSRLAHLLLSRRCKPHQILVLSFTHNAAKRLLMRAESMLLNSVSSLHSVESFISSSEVHCNTFHGFCSVVLKNYGHLLNLEKNLKIADEYEQLNIMKFLLKSGGYKSSNSAMATNLLRRIRSWKESGLGYLGVQEDFLKSWTDKRAYELYPVYQRELRSRSALDFGDLLLFTLRLFRENRHVLEIYRDKYYHILVDEFQDISPAQYDILRMLVVGFLDIFSIDRNGCKTFIGLSASRDTISVNEMRRSVNVDGNLEHEANSFPSEFFLEEISADMDESDLNTSTRVTNEGLRRVHVFCAGDDDQSIYGFRGSQIELMRRFRFDFPDAKVMKFDTSYRLPNSLCQIAKSVVDPLPNRISKVLIDKMGKIETGPSLEIRKLLDENCELEWISGCLENELKDELRGSVAVLGRTQKDVLRIASMLSKKRMIFTLKTTSYDSVSQPMSETANCIPDGVSLMTMHAAKGLEFNKVILPFWVEGNVPFAQQHNCNPNDERRLAFVSLTRAREKVIITFSKFSSSNLKESLRTDNEPSSYIEELVNNQNEDLNINFQDLCMYNVDDIKKSQPKFIDTPKDRRCAEYSTMGMTIRMMRTSGLNQTLHNAMYRSDEKKKSSLVSSISNVFRHDDSGALQRDVCVGNEMITFLSSTANEIGEINSIFLKPLDDLVYEDIIKLMNNKLVNKKSLKDLFVKKIRYMNSSKRMTIPIASPDEENVRKPLSKCSAEELGRYLLHHLKLN